MSINGVNTVLRVRGASLTRVVLVTAVVALLADTRFSNQFTPLEVSLAAALLASLLFVVGGYSRWFVLSPLTIAFALLCVASIAWSDYPVAALDGALSVVALLCAATLVGSATSAREIAWGIVVAQSVILVLSVVLLIADTGSALVAVDYEAGAFRGVFNHRNLFAFFMLVGFAASLALAARGWRDAAVQLVFSGAFLAGIAVSRSSTSVLVAVVVMAVFLLIIAVRALPRSWRGRTSAAIAVLGVSVLTLAVMNSSTVVGLLGRDDTLTGRTAIWDEVSRYVQERPILGFGWNSVWGRGQSPGVEIDGAFDFSVPHAHSVWWEMLITLGWVGLALTVISLVVVLAYSLPASLLGVVHAPILWCLLGTILLVHGVAESMLVRPLGLFLFLLMVARAPLDSRRIVRAGQWLSRRVRVPFDSRP